MGKRIHGLAVALALMASAPASAAWLEASNRYFVVYGNVPQSTMQRFADRLEHYGAALRAFLRSPEDNLGTSQRVRIYLVSSEGQVRKTLSGKSGGNVAGFYRSDLDGPIIVAPVSTESGDEYFTPELVLFHEYAHHILLGNASTIYPGWVSEGLAELFSTAVINRDGGVDFGYPANARAASVLTADPMSARKLLQSDTAKLDEEDTEQKYARGWLLCHYLLLSGQRPGQWDAFLKEVSQGKKPVEAGEAVFGDLKKLDNQLDTYRLGHFRGFRITAEKQKPDPVRIRQMDEAEAAIMPYHFSSVTGETAKQAAAALLDAQKIAVTYPKSAFVQRVMAEIAFDAGRDADAEAAADRALAIDSANVAAMIYKARVHIRRAANAKPADPALWREARGWIVKANRLDPNYALPLVMFYRSYGEAGLTPTQNAIDGLLNAVILAPQTDGPRFLAFGAIAQKGDLAFARAILAPVAFNPHAAPDNPARKLVDLIDSGADAAAVYAAWRLVAGESGA